MSKVTYNFLKIILLMSTALSAHAAVPQMLPYSGSISVRGEPFTGTGLFKFAIVNTACTGLSQENCKVLWANASDYTVAGDAPNSHVEVEVVQGEFKLFLGDITMNNGNSVMNPITSNLLEESESNLLLRVWFSEGGGANFEQLTPDRRIASVPFALRAKRAENVPRVILDKKIAAIFNTPGDSGTLDIPAAGYVNVEIHGRSYASNSAYGVTLLIKNNGNVEQTIHIGDFPVPIINDVNLENNRVSMNRMIKLPASREYEVLFKEFPNASPVNIAIYEYEIQATFIPDYTN